MRNDTVTTYYRQRVSRRNSGYGMGYDEWRLEEIDNLNELLERYKDVDFVQLEERIDRFREEIDSGIMEKTPKQKTMELLEAMEFCVKKGLVTREELREATEKGMKLELFLRAKIRMERYLKVHPQEKR